VFFFVSTACDIAAEILYYVVKLFGSWAYGSAQEKACTCIPEDWMTSSTQLIKPKTAEIDTEQSKSIFQNIYDNFSAIFTKFIDLLRSTPIVQSARFIVKPFINFFHGICTNFGVTPLESEAGFTEILPFLVECISKAFTFASNAFVSKLNRLIE